MYVWEKKDTKLPGFNLFFTENCSLSSGHVNTGYLLHHDAEEKRSLKRLFYPLFFSITVAGLLQESLPIHHCSSLDVALPVRAWPLFPVHPLCYIAPSRCATCTGAPAWLTDPHHTTEAASFHLSGFVSPGEASVPLQPPPGWISREERTSLMLSSPRCGQAHCPPAPKHQQSSVMHGKRSVVKLYKKLLQGNMSPGKHTVA